MRIAVSGDAIVTRDVSSCRDERFLDAIEAFRDADVAFTHLETNLLEYDDEAVYPSANAGGTWMRSPPSVAGTLGWMGVDVVSHASNHALDYSYGGLEGTWDALTDAGIPFAGTGRTLGDARAPAYVETPEGRVGLVSMTSSSQQWAFAGEPRTDLRGRPGNNPLRYTRVVDGDTMEQLIEVGQRLGWWLTRPRDGVLEVTKPGLHNSEEQYEVGDESTTKPRLKDLAGNKRAIKDASARAEYVVAHLHTHEFDPAGDIADPAAFVRTTARECIDAGADIFVAQGSHSPLRGIELYREAPIFYDPGDLFRMADLVERLPTEFYRRWEEQLDVPPELATPSQGFSARRADDELSANSGYSGMVSPRKGYLEGSVLGHVIPTCTFKDGQLTELTLQPGTFLDDPPISKLGLPMRAYGDEAREIIDDLRAKSAVFGTCIEFENGVGTVQI